MGNGVGLCILTKMDLGGGGGEFDVEYDSADQFVEYCAGGAPFGPLWGPK